MVFRVVEDVSLPTFVPSYEGPRRVLYDAAISGREHLRGLATPASLAKSGELTFLIKALDKLGL